MATAMTQIGPPTRQYGLETLSLAVAIPDEHVKRVSRVPLHVAWAGGVLLESRGMSCLVSCKTTAGRETSDLAWTGTALPEVGGLWHRSTAENQHYAYVLRST